MPNEHGYAYKEVGRRIRELRGRDRQKDWAKEIGCDQGYISQVENGVTKPSLAFLRSVAALKNASIDWMLTGRQSATGDPKGAPSKPSGNPHYEALAEELESHQILSPEFRNNILVLATRAMETERERGRLCHQSLETHQS